MNSKVARHTLLRLMALLSPFIWAELSEAQVLLPGERLPRLSDVGVEVAIEFSTSGIFSYSYTLTNPRQSDGEITRIEVDISKSSEANALSGEGLINDSSFMVSTSKLIEAEMGRLLVKAAFRSPAGWLSGPTVRLTAEWGAIEESALIQPGESARGFEIRSRGLPGIRSLTVHPEFAQTPVSSASKADVERLKDIEGRIKFTTATVGPVAPLSLEPKSLIENIISLKHQAVSLIWLGGREFIEKLDRKLDQSNRALVEGKPFKARKKLEQFIRSLESQRKKQGQLQQGASDTGKAQRESRPEGDPRFLTDNAYFLLKPNAEFIISKLLDRPKDREEQREAEEIEREAED